MSQNLPIVILNPGGTQWANNLTAAGMVKALPAGALTQPGKLRRINVQAPGSSGEFAFYDVALIGAYSSTTQYYPGQGVTSGGNVYLCILPSLGNAVSNGTYWTEQNPVLYFPYNATGIYAGALLAPDWPFDNGIYLGTVPSGSPILNCSFD